MIEERVVSERKRKRRWRGKSQKSKLRCGLMWRDLPFEGIGVGSPCYVGDSGSGHSLGNKGGWFRGKRVIVIKKERDKKEEDRCGVGTVCRLVSAVGGRENRGTGEECCVRDDERGKRGQKGCCWSHFWLLSSREGHFLRRCSFLTGA